MSKLLTNKDKSGLMAALRKANSPLICDGCGRKSRKMTLQKDGSRWCPRCVTNR